MNDLISVIIPVYNIENEIENCVKSVLNQTLSNIEIILVDDGSTDKSGLIIDQLHRLNPEKVKVYHKKNGGVTSARLLGVEKSNGEWIGFVDGDDVIEKDMYEMLLFNALKYNAQISHCGYQMIFSDGRVKFFHDTGCLIIQDRTASLIDLLDGSRIEPGLWNKLFHKNLFHSLLNTDRMPQDIKNNEDLLMNYYLFSQAEKTVFEDKCKYHYLIRMCSASRQKLNMNLIFDPIKVKQIILDNCDKAIDIAAHKAYVNTCTHAYCSLVIAEDQDWEEEKKEVRSYLIEKYKWCKLLSKRTKLLAILIVKCPLILQLIYPVYVKYWQKKKYS